MNTGEFFGESGALSRELPGYSPRTGQVQMAGAVEEAILCGDSIMIEAPTGTGKSLAYLVPAIQWAVQNNSRVVVATANIALQEQLMKKDLPFLQSVLGIDFRFALAKGRSNYLCLNAVEDEDMDESEAGDFREQLDDVLAWAEETATGDLSELNYQLNYRVKRLVTVSSDDCLGKKCPQRERCFAQIAKGKFEESHVIVANYAMLFVDMLVSDATDGNVSVLPPHEVVVFDEAHRAPDIAREFFGRKLYAGAVRKAVSGLRKGNKMFPDKMMEAANALADDVVFATEDFFARLGDCVQKCQPRITEPLDVDAKRLLQSLNRASEFYSVIANDEGEATESRVKADKLRGRCQSIAMTVLGFLRLEPDDHVHYFDTSGPSLAIASKPVNIGPVLAERLAGKTVIATSATLTVGGSFIPTAKELGMDQASTLIVDSPFDHERQSAFSVCTSAPDVNSPDFPGWVARQIEGIVRASDGRALCLFTSYKNLDASYDHLKRLKLPFKVMRQNDAPPTKLVERFKADKHSVLLGTETFWAGVDVPGEALSVVIIDKLPFPGMSDPVLDWIKARDRDWFMKYSVPRAVIQFRQGVGRLIRSASDRGVVIALDPRLTTKGYKKTFLRSLPPMPVFREPITAVESVLGLAPEQLPLIAG